MGFGSVWHWLIVLVVVLVIFGPGRIKNLGKELGGAVKGFKDGMKDADGNPQVTQNTANPTAEKSTIDVNAREKS